MCPGCCYKIKRLSLILVSALLIARAAYADDMLLGHFKPLLFWGWRGVNWRDSFLHHRENKCHSGDLGGERAGKASEILPLLFLWFSRQIHKCNPRLQGFRELRCEICGLASLGDAGQGMLDASVTSVRAGGSWGGRWKAWQKPCALAGMRDQGLGVGQFS